MDLRTDVYRGNKEEAGGMYREARLIIYSTLDDWPQGQHRYIYVFIESVKEIKARVHTVLKVYNS